MGDMRQAAFHVLASVSPAWRMVNSLRRRALTVLAYHEVADPVRFSRQMDHVAQHYTVLDVEDVVRCFHGSLTVARPAWITFDDGHPSVVEEGMPILSSFQLPATMFVCPGVIEGDGWQWWQVVETAAKEGIVLDGLPVVASEVIALKSVSDEDRRQRVETVQQALASMGKGVIRERLTPAHLSRWVLDGHSIGNHTWDHPLLDMCSDEEQRSQITHAHQWLIENVSPRVSVFAYPNGNTTHFAEQVLAALGYDMAVLFDHRVDRMAHPLRISRVRVNATDTLAEFKAKVSGAHPFVHHMRHH